MKHSIRLRFVAGAVLGRYFMMKLPPAVCLLCFASLVFICHPVSAQQVKKVTRGIEPVSLGPLIVGDNIKSKDGELNIQDELTLAKDSRWAQTLKVEVRNNYSKPMIYFELGVHVYSKTPGKDPFFLFFPKGFFNFTGVPPPPGAPKPEEISIEPGESVVIDLGDKRYASLWERFYADRPVSDWAKVNILPQRMVFADSLMWSSGTFSERDPLNPREWVPVNKKLLRPDKKDAQEFIRQISFNGKKAAVQSEPGGPKCGIYQRQKSYDCIPGQYWCYVWGDEFIDGNPSYRYSQSYSRGPVYCLEIYWMQQCATGQLYVPDGRACDIETDLTPPTGPTRPLRTSAPPLNGRVITIERTYRHHNLM